MLDLSTSSRFAVLEKAVAVCDVCQAMATPSRPSIGMDIAEMRLTMETFRRSHRREEEAEEARASQSGCQQFQEKALLAAGNATAAAADTATAEAPVPVVAPVDRRISGYLAQLRTLFPAAAADVDKTLRILKRRSASPDGVDCPAGDGGRRPKSRPRVDDEVFSTNIAMASNDSGQLMVTVRLTLG